MNIKFVLSLFPALLSLGFIACVNNITKDYGSLENVSAAYPKEIKKLLSKEYKEPITAVGQATGTDRTAALKKAELAADVEIKKAFEQELALLQKDFNDDRFLLFTLRRTKTVKEITTQDNYGFTAFVLKAVSLDVIKEQIDAMQETVIKEQAAYKELEARIERSKL